MDYLINIWEGDGLLMGVRWTIKLIINRPWLLIGFRGRV